MDARSFVLLTALLGFAGGAPTARAADCPADHAKLLQALRASVKPSGGPSNGGLDNNEWAALVARDGTVCAIAFSGAAPTDQWLGSRAIALEKANTANALSLNGYALSTANLFAGVQPGGFLFGLDATNPPNAAMLYDGDPSKYGGEADPVLGRRVGGVVTFGGGLALYSGDAVVGGLGASGDTSCADHNIAWRIRQALGLDKVPAGPGPDHNDEIIYDLAPDKTSASGFGHPMCKGTEPEIAEQIHAGFVPRWAKAMK
jgi:Haem-degrading